MAAASEPARAADPPATRVRVTTAKTLDRQSVVLAVFDLHTTADSEDKGFEELRRHAAELGADAVIGAEFEHGEAGGPSHLSGMAVRYSDPLPPYDVIGPIDVSTPGDASDKGMAELLRRAHQLGADDVLGVNFEHGEGTEPSHLRGTAVRFRR